MQPQEKSSADGTTEGCSLPGLPVTERLQSANGQSLQVSQGGGRVRMSHRGSLPSAGVSHLVKELVSAGDTKWYLPAGARGVQVQGFPAWDSVSSLEKSLSSGQEK